MEEGGHPRSKRAARWSVEEESKSKATIEHKRFVVRTLKGLRPKRPKHWRNPFKVIIDKCLHRPLPSDSDRNSDQRSLEPLNQKPQPKASSKSLVEPENTYIDEWAPQLPDPPRQHIATLKERYLTSTKSSVFFKISLPDEVLVHKHMRKHARPGNSEWKLHRDMRYTVYRAYASLSGLPGRSTPYANIPGIRSLICRHNLDGQEITGFTMKYIPPMHPGMCRYLVRKYLHPSVQNAAMGHPGFPEMKVLLHMGELSVDDSHRIDNLQVRPGCFDRLWAEAPMSVRGWARMMGTTLAILHYACHVDGRGVKFWIGFRANKHNIYLSSFGNCKAIVRTENCALTAMVDAVVTNPCWPKPSISPEYDDFHNRVPYAPEAPKRSWKNFEAAYKHSAKSIMVIQGTREKDIAIPGIFLRGLKLNALQAAGAQLV